MFARFLQTLNCRARAWFCVPLLVATAVAGCSSQEAATDSDKLTVAFVSNNSAEFWTFAQRGTEKAAKDFDVNAAFRMPATGTVEEQAEIIDALLVSGVKGIAVSPSDSVNQATYLNGIAEQVPLIAQDSDLPAGSKRVCYIGTDNYEAGKAAGVMLKEALPDGGKVIIFVGKLDSLNAVQRRQGVMDELAGTKDAEGPMLGNYELLATLTDGADAKQCADNAQDALTKYGDHVGSLGMVGLWAYNPPAMLGALKQAKLEGKVPLVAFDEDAATLQGIADGYIIGTVAQQPFEFGYQSVKLLAALARGENPEIPADGIILLPHRVIKKDSVAAFEKELATLRGE